MEGILLAQLNFCTQRDIALSVMRAYDFDILLTVHLSIILVTGQLNV